MKRGEVWWADLDVPTGSAPGFRRPVVILQADWILQTRLGTVIIVPLTSNIRAAAAPGNVLIDPKDSGLSVPSVANVSQIASIDRSVLIDRCHRLPDPLVRAIEDGVRMMLDL